MEVRQGIDITSVRRMKQVIERQGGRFLNRVFTPRERAYCDAQRMKYEHYAARFAAKEAAMKAMEVRRESGFCLREIEILRRPTGQPFISISPASRRRLGLPRRYQMALSLTHEREYAMALVLLLVSGRNLKKK